MFSIFNRNNNKEDILAGDLDQVLDTIHLIDIREDYELSSGKIKTAQHIPMGHLLSTPERYLNKDEQYYIMCQSGMRSMRTVKALQEKGYHVINVKGGMAAYKGKNRI